MQQPNMSGNVSEISDYSFIVFNSSKVLHKYCGLCLHTARAYKDLVYWLYCHIIQHNITRDNFFDFLRTSKRFIHLSSHCRAPQACFWPHVFVCSKIDIETIFFLFLSAPLAVDIVWLACASLAIFFSGSGCNSNSFFNQFLHCLNHYKW